MNKYETVMKTTFEIQVVMTLTPDQHVQREKAHQTALQINENSVFCAREDFCRCAGLASFGRVWARRSARILTWSGHCCPWPFFGPTEIVIHVSSSPTFFSKDVANWPNIYLILMLTFTLKNSFTAPTIRTVALGTIPVFFPVECRKPCVHRRGVMGQCRRLTP